MFTKSCKYCGNTFESESRNTRYCSDECCDKAQVKRKAHNKTKKRKRKLYEENREINIALTQAYRLAHQVADLFHLPKKCACCSGEEIPGLADEDKEVACEGPLELHHRDLNVFRNDVSNLVWLCKKHHSILHTHLKNVNMVDVYREAEDAAGFEEEDEKYLVMAKVFHDRVYGVEDISEG